MKRLCPILCLTLVACAAPPRPPTAPPSEEALAALERDLERDLITVPSRADAVPLTSAAVIEALRTAGLEAGLRLPPASAPRELSTGLIPLVPRIEPTAEAPPAYESFAIGGLQRLMRDDVLIAVIQHYVPLRGGETYYGVLERNLVVSLPPQAAEQVGQVIAALKVVLRPD